MEQQPDSQHVLQTQVPRLLVELILHTLEFAPTADLTRLLDDRTTFRALPALILRQRFLRMLEAPNLSLSFECSLPMGYTVDARQDHKLKFSHIDDTCTNLTAHFTFPQSGPPFAFNLESREAFQTVLYTLSLRYNIKGTRKLTYTMTILDGIYRFFRTSFHPISRTVKHSLADAPTPPCALHALHLPPDAPFTSASARHRSQLSSSFPASFPFPDHVTRYSLKFQSIEISIPQLLLINEENEAREDCTVFILGR
ncbi:hypothetical protein DACRYDRAFT_111157 [Dacryopinax primogenitus]|uniref:Uncharacterized protein n=1 Tax=Dacryopinax primogenitus (strain DJM 731) TaxID=1858805 RepID=M5G366_DACPD|nr:uncharacterized protein DACRYDRAFT_111157 [Dacryopinax primogenitus]EJT98182.1 hypothetical protein DACRYDRAFT_111157 [Dacryopinax primogenitus]